VLADVGYQVAYSFPAPRPKRYRGSAERVMLTGCLMGLAGIVLTGISYALASPGGVYFVFWGLILFGGIRFMRGMLREDY
jgi:hypothetical protein